MGVIVVTAQLKAVGRYSVVAVVPACTADMKILFRRNPALAVNDLAINARGAFGHRVQALPSEVSAGPVDF